MLRSIWSKLALREMLFGSRTLPSAPNTTVPFVPLHTQILDRSLALKTSKAPTDESKTKTNRLAILFAWMLAKGRHIDNYSNLYLQQGFDVLTVNILPQELIFPTTGSQVVAQKVLDYLESHPEYDKVIVHAFSVGAYLFGECMEKMKNGGEKYVPIMKKFSGIVCDSAVDYYGIPEGLAKAVFKNPVAIATMEHSLRLYMRLFYQIATKHYIKSSEAFHENFLTCPALFVASEADPVGSIKAQESVVQSWIRRGIDVRTKYFEKSLHVGHMPKYPEEYTAVVYDLLKRAGLYGNQV
ncbi:transmembrane protein 53-A [Centruroides vittatus]|uniref:transmembrane protein 53-A n=1 Tax=Centruroides vittatus TaxID=120091 RepID=UPI00350F5801